MSLVRRFRRTKIIVTLGPSTGYRNNLEKVIVAGANEVRLNFSHGKMQEHLNRAKEVRKIASRLGRYIAILGDLQGPKIGISTFKVGQVFLNQVDLFILDTEFKDREGNKNKVGIDYKYLPNDVSSGDILILDDGRVQLKVLHVNKTKIYTEVLIGGILSDNKGINKFGGGLSAISFN